MTITQQYIATMTTSILLQSSSLTTLWNTVMYRCNM